MSSAPGKKSLSGALGIVVGFVVIAVALTGGRLGSARNGHGSVPQPVAPNFCGGRPITLAQVQALTDFQVFVPHNILANPTSMSDVWLCPGGTVVMVFRSGISIQMEKNTIPDPAAVWTRWASEYPTVTVGTVRGKAASLSDPGKDPSGLTEGGVELVDNGVHIIVAGNGQIPISDLVSVTESLT